MSRIQNQTPSNRRAAPKRIKLTAEQIEINRSNRRKEQYRIAKRRRSALKTFFVRFVLFLVVFAVMLGICAAGFFISLTRKDPEDASGWSYRIGGERSNLSAEDAVIDGRVYVSFTDVAEMLELAVTGSAEDMKYVIKGDEAETIRFKAGTREVYVNNVETRLAGDSYYKNEELYVPVDFVSAYFKGLTVEVDERAHRVTVEREITNLAENGKLPWGEEPQYGELFFLLQSMAPMDGIKEDDAVEATMPDLGFVTSIGIYEEYMNPGNTTEYLTLINYDNRLAADYVPNDLMVVANTRKDGRNDQLLRLNAAMALEALFREMKAAGFEDVDVTSAYRSYSYQEQLFAPTLQKYLGLGHDKEEATRLAMEESLRMPAGASEHQSGLCLDMHNISTGASEAFAETDAYKWLEENCWKFGFILRYPADKVEITGIAYEPWHYRYVGRYHAARIYESGLCLEEYWAKLNA